MQRVLEQLKALASNPEKDRSLVEIWNTFAPSMEEECVGENNEDGFDWYFKYASPRGLLSAARKGGWNESDKWYVGSLQACSDGGQIRFSNQPADFMNLPKLARAIVISKVMFNRHNNKPQIEKRGLINLEHLAELTEFPIGN